jgi:hypothetical protein
MKKKNRKFKHSNVQDIALSFWLQESSFQKQQYEIGVSLSTIHAYLYKNGSYISINLNEKFDFCTNL